MHVRPSEHANAQTPTVYDAFTGFSHVSNPTPDGIWSYGYKTDVGGELNLYANAVTEFGLSIWQQGLFLHSHPGPAGEFSVIRWTAPASPPSVPRR